MGHPIRPYACEGAWTSNHSLHYRSAYLFLEEFRDCLSQLEQEKRRLTEDLKASGFDEDLLESYVDHETRTLQHRGYRLGSAALLFACMSLEGFLNHYGVKRLGETYYKRFVERLGITEKLAYLMSLCDGKLISPSDSVIACCRRLFDARNALSHPKTKEIHLHELKPDSETPNTRIVDACFTDLESCIDFLCGADQDIDRSFSFPFHEIPDCPSD